MILAFTIIGGFFSGYAVNKHVKSYQRKRIEAFLAPSADPKGASYNVLQAQIAMGAGGVLGKGVFSGTQSRLGFVPERHTDFILAILGEESGLIGTLLVLGLYILILWRIVVIAQNSSDLFGYLLCSGIFDCLCFIQNQAVPCPVLELLHPRRHTIRCDIEKSVRALCLFFQQPCTFPMQNDVFYLWCKTPCFFLPVSQQRSRHNQQHLRILPVLVALTVKRRCCIITLWDETS